MDGSGRITGKTVLITGGTSGIGFHTASAQASQGATVYITGRNLKRGQEAVRQIQATAGQDRVYFLQADASTVGGNQELAQTFLEEAGQLHVLINNVGGLYNDRWETEDGYEATLAMNLVGPFALTAALLPALAQDGPGRIVNVTSASFAMWKGDPFVDPHSVENFTGFHAYNRSKYLNLLWTLALARRLQGSRIVANALHPGTAWTHMTQNNAVRLLPPGLRLVWPVFRLLQRNGSPVKAAQTSIYLASAPEARIFSGEYFESSRRPKELPQAMLDPVEQEKAWDLAESLVWDAPTNILAGEIVAVRALS